MKWVQKMNSLKIPFGPTDLFPVFIDFDFKNRRCRGMSAKLEFFTYGLLSKIVDDTTEKEYDLIAREGIYIRKNGLFLENGFFLYDFEKAMNNQREFAEKVKGAGFENLYFEKSKYYDLTDILKKFDWLEVSSLEFDDAPHCKS